MFLIKKSSNKCNSDQLKLKKGKSFLAFAVMVMIRVQAEKGMTLAWTMPRRSSSISASTFTTTALPFSQWILTITLFSENQALISGSCLLAAAGVPDGADNGDPSPSGAAAAWRQGLFTTPTVSMLLPVLLPLASSPLSFSWSSFTYRVASERIVALSI
jgi:hypothetical protein